MSVVTMKLYETLATKFGPENAEILSNFIEEKIGEKQTNMENRLLSKMDNLGIEIKQEIRQDIAELKVALYKWTITIYLSALAILVALIAFLKN